MSVSLWRVQWGISVVVDEIFKLATLHSHFAIHNPSEVVGMQLSMNSE